MKNITYCTIRPSSPAACPPLPVALDAAAPRLPLHYKNVSIYKKLMGNNLLIK